MRSQVNRRLDVTCGDGMIRKILTILSLIGVLLSVGAIHGCRREVKDFASAIRAGDLETIQQLVQAHPELLDTIVFERGGWLPIHLAVNAGHLVVVKFLIAKGASPNARNKTGTTPLSNAAMDGRTDIVEFLIANGGRVNTRNVIGSTPLHAAALEGHVQVVRILLANGAKVDAKLNSGVTSLHLAVLEGHIQVVRLLLANGAKGWCQRQKRHHASAACCE